MEKSILICTLAPSNQCYVYYLLKIIKLDRYLEEKKINNEFIFSNEILGRNLMINYFLESNFSHLLFINNDIEINIINLYKLIESDKDFIGIIYPEPFINWENIKNHSNNLLSSINAESLINYSKMFNIKIISQIDELFEVESLKCGITLLKRNVFTSLIEKYPNDYYIYNEKKIFKFFDIIANQNEFLSEDEYFCKKWRNIGGKIFTYNNIIGNLISHKKYD